MAGPLVASRWFDKDKGFVPQVTRGPEGITGVSYYLVNTGDEGEAVAAAGLPAYLSPWGTGILANLLARRFTGRPMGGGIGVEQGVSVVQVDWASMGEYSGVTPERNFSWTELAPTVAQVIQKYDRRYTGGIEYNTPILNGDGVPKDVGMLNLVVHKFIRPVDLTRGLLGRIIDLHARQAVNLEAVTLPPILGGGVAWTFNPGELRFRAFTPPNRPISEATTGDALIEVLFTLGAAPDHLFRWVGENADGSATGIFPTEQYDPVTMLALF